MRSVNLSFCVIIASVREEIREHPFKSYRFKGREGHSPACLEKIYVLLAVWLQVPHLHTCIVETEMQQRVFPMTALWPVDARLCCETWTTEML